jgi:hypothetical protein
MSELKCCKHSVSLICSFLSPVNEILVCYYSKIFLLVSIFERLVLILIFAKILVMRLEYAPCLIPNTNKSFFAVISRLNFSPDKLT